MNDLERRLADVEHQLGRKLTQNECSLMELWYEKFEDKLTRASRPTASDANRATITRDHACAPFMTGRVPLV